MKWKWVMLLYVLQGVLSLELGTSTLPAIGNKKINKGPHKSLSIPNHLMEFANDPGSLHDIPESHFPDVVYPTTILEAAQPFYYSQHGYDEVLGPFSNDIKSSYRTLATGKGKIPSTDSPTSLSNNHKTVISLNTSSINDDIPETTISESHDNSSSHEVDQTNTEQNSTYTILDDTVIKNNTKDTHHDNSNHRDQQHRIDEEISQDVSEEMNSTNEDIFDGKSEELVQDMEENLHWKEIPVIENKMINELKENVFERNTIQESNDSKSNQEDIIPNNFEFSNINNVQGETELLYAKDINTIYSNNWSPNNIITLDTKDNQHTSDLDKIDAIMSDNTTYVNINSNHIPILNTNNQDENRDILDALSNTCTNYEEDTESLDTINKNENHTAILHTTNQDENRDKLDALSNMGTNSKEDTESLDTNNKNKIEYIILTPENFVSSGTSDSQNDSETLETVNVNNKTFTSNHTTTPFTNIDQNHLEILDVINNQPINQEDKELLNIRDNNTTPHITLTPNFTEPEIVSNSEKDTEMLERKDCYETCINETPNYVVTSDTGNTREDFVTDITNIYALIEETLRAVSVVEFIVSKTLDSLGLKENQNGTVTYKLQFNNK